MSSMPALEGGTITRSPARSRLAFSAACLPFIIITFVAFIVLTLSPASVWSNWGRQRGTSACEPLQEASAVREPINSWSNFIYTAVGAWAIGAGARDLITPAATAPPVGQLEASPLFSILLGLTWVSLGMFSFLFHGANVRLWRQYDVGFTVNAGLVMVAWSACSLTLWHVPACARHPRLTRASWMLCTVVAEALFVELKFEYSVTIALSAVVGVLILLECIVQPLLARRSCRQRSFTALAVLLMLVAYILRQLESSWGSRPLCLNSNWFQPHALWHLLSGVSIALVYAVWRLPPPPEPLKRTWRRSKALTSTIKADESSNIMA